LDKVLHRTKRFTAQTTSTKHFARQSTLPHKELEIKKPWTKKSVDSKGAKSTASYVMEK
jgi:hypothetical protein